MRMPLASVVIPAHDEESVIGRCLRRLTEGALPGELDVIVVANACRDHTAEVARAGGARVVETEVPGKAHAIGLGDRLCRTFPRLYLDADVTLTADAVRLLVATVDDRDVLACAPVPVFDLSGASWPVRRFHRVLHRLRGDTAALSGAGAYLLGERAHARAFPLPAVIADDGWVHRQLAPGERAVVNAAPVSVRLPRTLASVVRRRARVRLGNRELDRLGCPAPEQPLGAGQLAALVRRRTVSVLDAACFLTVLFAERALANWREARGTAAKWSPDPTSRAAS